MKVEDCFIKSTTFYIFRCNMSLKEKANRRTGIYRTKDSIRNFKIKVKLKQINTFINLPPLCDGDIEYGAETQDSTEEEIIWWQQKIFSKEEGETYKIRENCFTEQQIQYCAQIAEEGESSSYNSSIFTYIADENEEIAKPITYTSSLHRGMETLRLDTNEPEDRDKHESEEIVVKESSHYVDNEYTTMRIMASLNPDIELCSIRWYPKRGTLMIYPDFNHHGQGDDMDDYTITVDTDGRRVYRYSLEHASVQEETADRRFKEIQLENKLSKLRASPTKPEFTLPPRRSAFTMLLLEISRGTEFASSGALYVRYALDAPAGWISTPTQGSTSCNKGAAWGHIAQLMLVRDLDITGEDTAGALQPKLYFEVISRDYWDRHRTEGFGVMVLNLSSAGSHTADVRCNRPRQGFLDALRRYMIGGCDRLDDLSWLSGYPNPQKGAKCLRYGIQTLSTGVLHVKYNVVTQRRLPHLSGEFTLKNRKGQRQSTADERYSLLRSVEYVVGAYRDARRRLREARGLPDEQIPHRDQHANQDTEDDLSDSTHQ